MQKVIQTLFKIDWKCHTYFFLHFRSKKRKKNKKTKTIPRSRHTVYIEDCWPISHPINIPNRNFNIWVWFALRDNVSPEKKSNYLMTRLICEDFPWPQMGHFFLFTLAESGELLSVIFFDFIVPVTRRHQQVSRFNPECSDVGYLLGPQQLFLCMF